MADIRFREHSPISNFGAIFMSAMGFIIYLCISGRHNSKIATTKKDLAQIREKLIKASFVKYTWNSEGTPVSPCFVSFLRSGISPRNPLGKKVKT